MNVMRQLSVLIWNDDKFPLLSDDAQIVFFHLLTTPHTTAFGLFKGGVATLAEEKRWDIERYRKALKVLLEQKMVRYDKAALLLYIPRALKYNPPTASALKLWSEVFVGLPSSPLKKAFYDDLSDVVASRNKPSLSEAFMTYFGDGSDLSVRDGAPVDVMDNDSLSKDNTDIFRVEETGGGKWDH